MANVSGSAANSYRVEIPNNPLRHSLILRSTLNPLLVFGGSQTTLSATVGSSNGFQIWRWDDFGDTLSMFQSITGAATETVLQVIEVYREETVEGQ